MTLINLDTSPLKLYLGVKGHLMVIDNLNKLANEIRLTLKLVVIKRSYPGSLASRKYL